MCLVTTALEAVASQNVSTLSLRRDIQRHHFIPHGLGNLAALSVGYLQRQRSQVVSPPCVHPYVSGRGEQEVQQLAQRVLPQRPLVEHCHGSRQQAVAEARVL